MSRARLLAVAAALVVATVGLWHSAAGGGQPTPQERVGAISESLRCPTCTAESIADSQAPMAASMRDTVRAQVRAGRSDEEIRAWFVDRYGTSVLLAPPVSGVSAVVWLLPGAALLGGLVVWYGVRRRRGGQSIPEPASGPAPEPAPDREPGLAPDPERGSEAGPLVEQSRGGADEGHAAGPRRRTGWTLRLVAAGAVSAVAAAVLALTGTADQPGGESDVARATAAERGADAPPGGADAAARGPEAVEGTRESAAGSGAAGDTVVTALRDAVREEPDRVEAWVALGRALEQRDRLPAARRAYQQAVRLAPEHPTARFLLAFVHVREGRAAAAATLLRQLLREHPDHPEALLLLGTVQREQGDPEARATLRRFLQVAPDHPASEQVQELLARRGGGARR